MAATGIDRRRVSAAAVLAAGLAVFALGLGLAWDRLPEWRQGPLPDKRLLGRDLAAIAAGCGFRLLGEGPRFELAESSRQKRLSSEVPITGAVPHAELLIRLDQTAVPLAAGQGAGAPSVAGARSRAATQSFKVWFEPGGAGGGARPREISAQPAGWREILAAMRQSTPPRASRPEAFAAALLAPGEQVGRRLRLYLAGQPLDAFAIAGSAPPAHVLVADVNLAVRASRNPGSLEWAAAQWAQVDPVTGSTDALPRELLLGVVAAAFVVLAIRRRVSVTNAAWLAALAGVAVLPEALRQGRAGAGAAGGGVLLVAAESLWLAVLWAAAESLWRTSDPRFDSSLDQLRARRPGRRAGQDLLRGAGLGAAAAGLGLAACALATLVPGAAVHALSVDLPVVDGWDGPLAAGITSAAAVAFLLACGRRLAPRHPLAVILAVTLAGAAVLAPVKLQPWPLQLAGGMLVVGALAAAGEVGGLTGLLAAGLSAQLLPAAVFSGLHLTWLPGGFALTAGAMALLLLAGAAGARRPPEAGEEAPRPPAFMVRLDQERRLAVEMDLLTGMQRGLLPEAPPAVPGWEIAARSLIADRAGGDLYDFARDRAGHLWLAAGDAAGHGYTCAIAQAMVKAALAILLDGERTPAQVLGEIDRVLRTTAAGRRFTSLALLRLDPATGEALLANAGHPYPLLAAPGEAAREIPLPGLPLGQGPPRLYADLALALAPGALLVLCSDGLAEAGAAGQASAPPYGYQRPLDRLGALAGRPAAAVLDGLLDDWRRFRGPGAPDDDTTVVVLHRLV
jgi:hypothetical protein